MNSKNRFEAIFDKRRAPTTDTSSDEISTVEERPVLQPVKQPRIKGKRSDSSFTQISAYIRKTTYRDVKIALLTEGGTREFSDLVEALLDDWLKSQR